MGTGPYTWVLPTGVLWGAVEAGVARGNGRTPSWCPRQPQHRVSLAGSTAELHFPGGHSGAAAS